MWNSAENLSARSSSFRSDDGGDEEALRWAALERLPTYKRVRKGIFRNIVGDLKEIDVEKLLVEERKVVLDRLVSSVEDDSERFFDRMRHRFDGVELVFPKIEVRFQHLTVESFVHVGSRALPTIPNFIFNMTEALLRKLHIYPGRRRKLTILDDISGIIRPSRLTLLLGPPSSGKTTLLLALAGRLGPDLQISGTITYNGHSLKEFVPQKTSAYVSQQDWHVAEMTVRETIDFSARCQGVGCKYDMLLELSRREKLAGIKPDEDLDILMKALALGGQDSSLVVEYILKILGLDICADTLVGDEMLKGISGGQKKRLTTGELLAGPSRVLFMDEISTGLDSSTTYQIIKYLRHSTHALDGTTIISLVSALKSHVTCYCFFFIVTDSISSGWIWGFWISPLMYAQNAASVNEFLGHSWDKRAGNHTNLSLGKALLKARSLFPQSYWYWIGVGALLGYTVLFNILFTIFLTYLNPLGKRQAVVSEEELQERDRRKKGGEPVVIQLRQFLEHSGSLKGKSFEQRGMVLPFQPLSMSFSNINYYVDVPLELKQQGVLEDRLQLLVNITGAFRPGVLTALVGVSGAGKTTLMDVLSGRKTGGIIEGNINISGYPKKQETFARISGYCEQNDIHSPCLTVLESLLFSAWLRLPLDVDPETQKAFVEEVMELVELTSLSGALVGLPGVDGLSTEQRKRLTIAVELVANPSIVFMDEPTSGLDARSAAIVMRTVRNIVNTGRTIVCTIHQPSIDIFESFDELLFMKRGGEVIYAGPLGPKSCKLIEYFEAVEGMPKIRPGYNPAAWMLDVTSSAEENRLGVDFAEVYRRSNLFQCNKELVEILSKPNRESKDLNFPTKYSQAYVDQFLACLWKQNLSYWRNPQYTAVRFFYTVIISLMLGTICWRFGSKRDTQQEIFNAMGSMYAAVLFIGVTNGTAVQPVVSVERFVSYRERAAGMYSALPFAFAQVAIEFPYVLAQTLIYCTIFYCMASFEWNAWKFIWYTFFMYFTVLYFTFYGMMTTAITPNHNVATIIAAPFYMLWNLFSGLMIPHKSIPIWWRWYYWANPVAWSLYGLLASQYGDSNKLVKLSDGVKSMPIRLLVKDVFGFRHDFVGVAAFMVVTFCMMFALIFAYGIKSFNFQKR
ncbi:ABC transporter G family member 32 like [Actinidia chinensis var. chinensis]|uniref:ABC transporter G family member 32 like n=1 Tax=Actinidia chinensis var. chinensis TaxID=1590841 RepID=A0A2R6S1S6_ACTCC|nr:ABC transporter G family member 32 like [Actinidia chinensis var. chinensis]